MSSTVDVPLGGSTAPAPPSGALERLVRLVRAEDSSAAAHQAFWLLRIAFTVAPILFGIDKFFNWTVYWPDYLANWVNSILPGNAQDFMHVVGGIEIFAGLLVAFLPRIGAFVVAGWLFGIVVNLLTKNAPEYYDIALRDFGLMLAALTFGRLSLAVVPERVRARAAAARKG